jgi:hypothetical protein
MSGVRIAVGQASGLSQKTKQFKKATAQARCLCHYFFCAVLFLFISASALPLPAKTLVMVR